MITLTYSQKTQDVERIIDRLDGLVVRYKDEENDQASAVVLRHNNKTFTGASAIEDYLNKLSKELEEWRVVECDRYYFE